MIEEAIVQAQNLVDALTELRDEINAEEADTTEPVEVAAPLAAVPSVDAEQVQTAEQGHDNSLPFKCPACGKTYETQVICTNGHPPEQTLPTGDVLAGAAPASASTGAELTTQPSEQAIVEQAAVAASPEPAPAAGPTWPDDGDSPAA